MVRVLRNEINMAQTTPHVFQMPVGTAAWDYKLKVIVIPSTTCLTVFASLKPESQRANSKVVGVTRLWSELQLKSEDWLLQWTSAPRLIRWLSTLAHFRCTDSWIDLANVLFHCREVTQSGIFTGHRRNVKLPIPPAHGLCHASFQDNEFLQAVSLKATPLYHTAQLHHFSSRNISK